MKKSNLLKDNKELMKEYDYDKNKELDLSALTIGLNIKVWWKCNKGHEWEASINNRTKGRGCPYCSNKKVLEGYNDLATTNPELVKEWNYEKNGELKPTMILSGSHKKVWWKCNKGHEWEAVVYNRSCGNKCIYCTNQKVLKGYNDLETLNPKLAKEWNYEKNGTLKPDMVMRGSNKKVWWKCERGHEWENKVSSRNSGIGCPICNEELQTSFPERTIYFYVKKYFKDAISNYRDDKLKNKEIDIFIPSLNVGIEYDGEYYHKGANKDIIKDRLCEENGIKLIRVREVKCPQYKSSSIKIKLEKNNDYISLEKAIVQVLLVLNINNFFPNINRDLDDIYRLMNYMKKEKSILAMNPKLIKQWNYEKNGNLKPDMVTSGSTKKVWWKCKKGHEWQAGVATRNKGIGCPYCSNKKVLKGYNDLETMNPKLASEWNYGKNKDSKPDMFTCGSHKRVWWKCKKGHEWQAVIFKRFMGRNCPYCSNQAILKGYNDLVTTNPELLNEWNYEKNKNLRPDMIPSGSNKKVWWKCKKGHEWYASIGSRSNGNACPYCSNKKVLKGYNDLETINPKLASEWNYKKNGDLSPSDVVFGSGKKVWWKCSICGYEWSTRVCYRSVGHGCPMCIRNK